MTATPGVNDPAWVNPFVDRLLQSTHKAVLLFSQDRRLVRMNASAERLFATSAGECLGRAVTDCPFVLFPDAARAFAQADALPRSDEIPEAGFQATDARGQTLDVRASLEAVRDDRGESAGYLLSLFQVQPNPEPVFGTEAAQLREIIDCLPVGVAVLDAKHGLVDANIAAGNLFELGGERLSTAALRDQVIAWYDVSGHPLASDDAFAIWGQVASRRVADMVVGIELHSGTRRWLRFSSRPIASANSSQRSLVAFSDDTFDHEYHRDLFGQIQEQSAALYAATEQVQAGQERLAQYAAQLRSQLDSVMEGVIITDASDHPVTYNDRFAKLFGLPAATNEGLEWEHVHTLIRGRFLDAGGMEQHIKAMLDEPDQESMTEWELSGERAVVLHTLPIRAKENDQVHGRIWVFRDVTDRRRARLEAESMAAFNQRILDWIPANVFVRDGEGRYLLANQATARAYNASVEEVLGHTDSELRGKAGRPLNTNKQMADTDRRIIAGDIDTARFDFPAQDTLEGKADYAVVKTAFTWHDGRRVVLGVSQDVTDKRRAEKELEARRRMLQGIIDFLPASVFVKDSEGRYVVANHSMAMLYGLEPLDIIGRTDSEITERMGVTPEWLDHLGRIEKASPSDGQQRVRHSLTVLADDGSEHHYVINKVPFPTEDGSEGTLGIWLDVTRETEADQIKQQLESIYKNVPVGIAIVDQNGVVVRVSQRFATMMGTDVADIESIDLLTEPLLAGTRAVADIRRSLHDGVEVIGELQLPNEPLHGRVLRYRLGPSLASNGTVSSVQVIIEDITEYRHLQDRLARTARLEALGQLAGGIAHSFRNMLTIVNSYTEMALLNKRLNARLRNDLEHVYQAGQRGAELARQLLAFSRRNELELSVFDLNDIVRTTSRMLEPLLTRSVRLVVEEYEKPLLVYADRTQVEQMLVNLAVNARQAMPDGGTLTIRTRQRRFNKPGGTDYLDPQPGRYALLEVDDTGYGLTAETRQHMFEPFFTTKSEDEGTGLGLSMAYGLIQSLGGGIDVDSACGRGTRFRLYLPRLLQREAVQLQTGNKLELPRARRGELLLIVDQDQTSRERMVRTLSQRLGYTVFDAINGADALDLCRELREPFDLVLTRIRLPDMAGPELVLQLKGLCSTGRVLYISQPDDPADSGVAIPRDATVIPSQELTLSVLAPTVRRMLDMPQGHPAVKENVRNGQA